MTELVVTGVSCCEWSMRVCAHNHKTFFRSHNGWMCLNHHWRDIRNWFSRWEKCTVMISNNSGIRTRKRLITLLEIVMIHISSMAMQIGPEVQRNILLHTNGINGIFISVVLKMLSPLRHSNHRDRFFKIFPHIPLKKKRSRRNFVHGLRSLSLTRQPTFSHILLLVVGKYDEFQKRWLWNLPQRESQMC